MCKNCFELADAQAAGAPTINYGLFFNSIIDFVIVAFVIFLVVRTANKMKKPKAAAPTAAPAPTNEEKLLGEIRDLLKKK